MVTNAERLPDAPVPDVDAAGLPARFSAAVWVGALGAFFAAYVFNFSVVHVVADTRVCQLALNDPLHNLVPHDLRWRFVTKTLYTMLTLGTLAWLIGTAYRGNHRPLLRWGIGLTLVCVLRDICILLVPLCRAGIEPGTVAVRSTPRLDLGFFSIPWQLWATNDLLFSGHVAEFILLSRATTHWPRYVRGGFWAFQGTQIFALLSTRGHYTVDIVLALPCAVFADTVVVALLRRAGHS